MIARASSERTQTAALYLLALMAALGPLPVDMYLPVVGRMSEELNASAAEAAASVSVVFIGLAIGQLVIGPYSDKIGRRPPLMVGLVASAVGAAICLLTSTIEMFLFGRLLQSLGSAAILVCARASIRDRLDESRAAGFFSTMTTFASISVIAAPSLGAALLVAFGWRSVFACILVLCVLTLIPSYFYVGESHDARARTLPRNPVRAYLSLLANRPFLGFMLCASCNGAAYFSYISLSPLVLMEAYPLSPTTYGLVMSVNGSALIISTQVNRMLLKRRNARQLLQAVSVAAVGLAAALVAWLMTGFGGVWGLIALCYLVSFTGGIVQPNSLAVGMSLAKESLGSSAALFGALTFFAGTVVSIIGGFLFDGTAVPMVLIIVTALLSMGAFLWLLAMRGQSIEAQST